MRVVVVASAPWRWDPSLVAQVLAADLVVAADGGANHLARLGVRPAAVVGDLDSIAPRVRRFVGEDRIVPRPDQDETDLHKTLAYCFDERGAERVTVLAATGGRLDHALESLSELVRWSRRGEVLLESGEQHVMAVPGALEVATRPGETVSLMPLGPCQGVRTVGLCWELGGEPLEVGRRTSISNRARGERVRVELASGPLLLLLPAHRPGW